MSDVVSQVVSFRTVDELVHVAHKKWDQLDATINKVGSARLEAGRVLLELRTRVEAGEVGDLAAVDWWGWFEDNFTRSRSDAEKLLALAAADDPVAAHETEKARVRVATQQWRARHGDAENFPVPPKPSLKLAEPAPEPRDNSGDETIAQIVALFLTLTHAQRFQCVRRINKVYRD